MASEPDHPDPDDWAADERRGRGRDRRADRGRGGRRLGDADQRASLLARPAAQLVVAVLIVAALVFLLLRAF